MNKLSKVLQYQLINQKASNKVASDVLVGAASKLAPAPAPNNGGGCHTGVGPNALMVIPENSRVISAVLPLGKPAVATQIPAPLPIEESVSMHLDMTGQGLTLNKIPVTLFDEAGYHKAKNGIVLPFPAGTVYIGSSANNLYGPWVSDLCGHAFIFNAVKIDISVVAGAAATADLQFQEMIRVFRHNTRTSQASQIEVSNYVDTESLHQKVRTLPLTDENARIDRGTAWVYNVYEGVKVTLTFFNNMRVVG